MYEIYSIETSAKRIECVIVCIVSHPNPECVV